MSPSESSATDATVLVSRYVALYLRYSMVMIERSDKKVPVSFYITHSQEDKLSDLSKKTQVPMSAYIREGLDWVLAKYRDRAGEQ